MTGRGKQLLGFSLMAAGEAILLVTVSDYLVAGGCSALLVLAGLLLANQGSRQAKHEARETVD